MVVFVSNLVGEINTSGIWICVAICGSVMIDCWRSLGSVFHTLFARYSKLSAYICTFLHRPSAYVSLTVVFYSFNLSCMAQWSVSLWAHHTVLHEIIIRLRWWFHKVSSSPNVTAFGLLTHPALVISLIDLPYRPGEQSQSSCGS